MVNSRILVVLALAAAFAAAARAEEVDGVAARVGSAVILKSDVVNEMRRRAAVGADQYKEVLGEMVERELVLKTASESKLQMQDWVIENRVREVVERAFNGDRNKLMEALAADRISYPEWRQRLKDDMIVAAMRWQVVDKYVSASPTAMRKEYAAHPERYKSDRRVTVSAILLGPGDADKRAEIDAALKTESFAELAKKYSSDAHAKDGGQWKDVKPEDVFRPEICDVIAKLAKGETSKWTQLDGWSFLIRKDSETGGSMRSFEEAYDAVAANVKNAEAKRLYDAWIARLKAETYIKVY